MTSEIQENREETITNVVPRETGKILVKEGLINEEQLQEAVRIQKESDTYVPIGQVLVGQKAITQKQLNLHLDRYGKRPRLGDVLIRSGVFTRSLLDKALEQQKEKGLRLGEVLVKMNFITEEAMRQALCIQLNIPFINLDSIVIDRNLANIISRNYAQKHLIVPISKIGDTITLAMDDPADTGLIEELKTFLGLNISVVTSTQTALQNAFNYLYEDPSLREIDFNLELIEEESTRRSKYLESSENRKADALMSNIISMGVKNSATDIHLETLDNRMLIRFRVDGVLIEPHLGSLKYDIYKHRREIISRIKILGKMNIAEKRRPQDGSFRARVAEDDQVTDIDFRVSIVLGYYGENAVLRILDPKNSPHSIHQLGFSEKFTDKLKQLLNGKNGIILITGATGSGKSTTLYGALMSLYKPGIKILTAEDPIEYVYDNITQCEVNQKIGNTFASYVRSFLRQDPEVIMIGEIRDNETAEMAFRAAQTGHLVLSTLHTNDAISAVPRLLGLNIDPNLITSCLLGVASQRLVREICTNCKEEYIPSKEILKEFFDVPPSDFRWFQGQKCSKCNHTGYKGRFAVAELWTPNENDVININRNASIDELRESSNQSTILLAEDAIEKLRNGRTNLEELIRALPYPNIYQFRRILASSQGNET